MRRGVIAISILACLAAGCMPAAGGSDGPAVLKEPSKEIGIIKDRLQRGPGWMLDVSGLDVAASERVPGRSAGHLKRFSGGSFEYYRLENKRMPDSYTYAIIYDRKTGDFWIERSGGFAYTYMIFGPGRLDGSGKVATGKR
jgi:hypothetical protein